jgi:hypothetical protein
MSKGGTDRRAAQLATRRPDLAEAVRSGIERNEEFCILSQPAGRKPNE